MKYPMMRHLKALSGCGMFILALILGVLLNRYGFIAEHIHVSVNVRLSKQEDLPLLVFSNITKYKVPNIVHFIWFGEKRELTFLNYVSILSAHKVQRPDKMMLHCDHLPVGPWWDRLWREVSITVVYRQPPSKVHGQMLRHMYHKADVAKILILMEYGGIYLDCDVIVVNPMDELRQYDATMGKEKPPKLIAGIIIARKNAPFLSVWYESYRNNYRPYDWDYNCARVTYQLYLQKPEMLHVEPYRLTTPDAQDLQLLWNQVISWRQLFVVHVMQHFLWRDIRHDDVKTMDSTFGQVVRYIYYGSPEIIYDHHTL